MFFHFANKKFLHYKSAFVIIRSFLIIEFAVLQDPSDICHEQPHSAVVTR